MPEISFHNLKVTGWYAIQLIGFSVHSQRWIVKSADSLFIQVYSSVAASPKSRSKVTQNAWWVLKAHCDAKSCI